MTAGISDAVLQASAGQLARAIAAGALSSVEIVRTFLDRIEAVNPALNAVVQMTAEAALEQARAADVQRAQGALLGPLHGVPFTAKDALDTAGVVTACGVPGRAAWVPHRDATAVARLRAAGAILLGKTNLPALCSTFECANEVYGRTNNPYDLARSPGGSSGGEAAIIAAAGSPLGLGSDAGGSIRMPCHYCGIAGLKPTAGRVPSTGHFPANIGWPVRGEIGPMARSVADLRLALGVIAGPDGSDVAVPPVSVDPFLAAAEDLRIAYYADNGQWAADDDTRAILHQAVSLLRERGAAVTEERPAPVPEAMELFARGRPKVAAVLDLLPELLEAGEWDLETMQGRSGEWLQRARRLDQSQLRSEIEYFVWAAKLDLFRQGMLAFGQRYDAVLCPVSARPALEHGFAADPDRAGAFNFTNAYNLAGWPAVTLRCGTSSEGLPIGLQVAAGPWREEVALGIAQVLEKALGGWQPPPI